MENEKNNSALEKAQNISKGQKKTKVSKKLPVKQSDKKVKNSKSAGEQKPSEKQSKKQEIERLRAQRRLEKARLRSHKKAERDKAKATRLREKLRKKAQLKEQKQRLKAERKARREMLKNESKVERERRIALEKTARRDAKQQRREQKIQLKKQRLAEKRERKERRDKMRERRKDRNRGRGGYIAAIISLGVATLVLASVLTFTFMMPTQTDTALEASYRKSFLDTVEQVNNIDLNLSKVLATSDSGAMQKYLVDTAINSELAENDIQQLPLQDESKFYTTKLINQIGDYAKYLNNKLVDGLTLTEQDYKGLEQLYSANLTLKDMLNQTVIDMGEDFMMSSVIDGGDGNLLINNFNQLQNLSVEYPELIYDGPFSDGQDAREIKGLAHEEITESQATDIFTQIFAKHIVDQVESVGSTSGEIECYNIQTVVDGDILYAQISKKGGKLIMFAFAGDCNDSVISEQTAKDNALEFLTSLGIENMSAVWINLSNNVYTINFAVEQNQVIVYPDLIKVRVCAQTGTVIGLEAKSYYTNHVEREINKPTINKQTALEKVSGNIEVKTSRLALVPIGVSSEKLCYEFSGEFDGATYFVYIDALTGRQVEMFKVIESTEGKLLM